MNKNRQSPKRKLLSDDVRRSATPHDIESMADLSRPQDLPERFISTVLREIEWARQRNDYSSLGRLAQQLESIPAQEKSEVVDEQLWQSFAGSCTVEAITQFLHVAKSEKLKSKARCTLASIEEVEQWRKAVNDDSVEGYEQYLALTPSGIHAAAARTRRDQLRISRLSQLWQDAEASASSEPWVRIIAELDDLEQFHTASERWKVLRHSAQEAHDQQLWNEACQLNTSRAYASYLHTSVLQQFKSPAKKRIAAIEADLEKSYRKASSQPSRENYDALIDFANTRSQSERASAILTELSQVDDRLWSEVQSDEKLTSLLKYQTQAPLVNRSVDLQKKLRAIEDSLFEKASESDKILDWTNYLKHAPTKHRVDEATKHLRRRVTLIERDCCNQRLLCLTDKIGELEMQFIAIPAGTVSAIYRGKKRQIALTRGFFSSLTVVTNGQMIALIGKSKETLRRDFRDAATNAEQRPRKRTVLKLQHSRCNDVSWSDAKEFVDGLNVLLKTVSKFSMVASIPSEARWIMASHHVATLNGLGNDVVENDFKGQPLNKFEWCEDDYRNEFSRRERETCEPERYSGIWIDPSHEITSFSRCLRAHHCNVMTWLGDPYEGELTAYAGADIRTLQISGLALKPRSETVHFLPREQMRTLFGDSIGWHDIGLSLRICIENLG